MRDEAKIKEFIDYSKSLGKNNEEIKAAYDTGIKQGMFDVMQPIQEPIENNNISTPTAPVLPTTEAQAPVTQNIQVKQLSPDRQARFDLMSGKAPDNNAVMSATKPLPENLDIAQQKLQTEQYMSKKTGVSIEDIRTDISKKDPGYWERTKKIWSDRFGKIAKTVDKVGEGKVDPISGPLRLLGDIAGGIVSQGFTTIKQADDVLGGKVQKRLGQELEYLKETTSVDELAAYYVPKIMSKANEVKETHPKIYDALKYIGEDLMAAANIADLVGVAVLGKKVVKEGVESGVTKSVKQYVKEGGESIKNKADDIIEAISPANIDELVKKQKQFSGKIFQGDEAGRDLGENVLRNQRVEMKGVKTYEQLKTNVGKGTKSILKEQDALLGSRKGGIDAFDKVLDTPTGKVKTNPMSVALFDVDEGLTKIGALEDYSKPLFDGDTLGNVVKKIKSGEATAKEINDFTRYYGYTFKTKIRTKAGVGDVKLGDISNRMENTRKGLKEGMENIVGPEDYKTFRDLDMEYSQLKEGSSYLEDVRKGIIKTENKLKELGVVGKIGRGIVNTLDFLTIGQGKRLILGIGSKLLPNQGTMMMNNISLREGLSKFLKNIEKINKKIDKIQGVKNPTTKRIMIKEINNMVDELKALPYKKGLTPSGDIDVKAGKIYPDGTIKKGKGPVELKSKRTIKQPGTSKLEPKGNKALPYKKGLKNTGDIDVKAGTIFPEGTIKKGKGVTELKPKIPIKQPGTTKGLDVKKKIQTPKRDAVGVGTPDSVLKNRELAKGMSNKSKMLEIKQLAEKADYDLQYYNLDKFNTTDITKFKNILLDKIESNKVDAKNIIENNKRKVTTKVINKDELSDIVKMKKDGHSDLFKTDIARPKDIKDVKYIERAISQAEYDNIIKNGYLKSNNSMNFEGQIGQTLFHVEGNGTKFYLPEDGGYIIKVKVNPKHDIKYNFVKEVYTTEKVSLNDIVEVQGGDGIFKIKTPTSKGLDKVKAKVGADKGLKTNTKLVPKLDKKVYKVDKEFSKGMTPSEIAFKPKKVTKSKGLDKVVTKDDLLNTIKELNPKDTDLFRQIKDLNRNNYLDNDMVVKEYYELLKKTNNVEFKNEINKEIKYIGQSYFDGLGRISNGGGYKKPTKKIIDNLPDFSKKEYIKLFPKPKKTTKPKGLTKKPSIEKIVVEPTTNDDFYNGKLGKQIKLKNGNNAKIIEIDGDDVIIEISDKDGIDSYYIQNNKKSIERFIETKNITKKEADITEANYKKEQGIREANYIKEADYKIKEYNDIDGFLEGQTPLKIGKAKKLLNTQNRKQNIKTKLNDGYKSTIRKEPTIEYNRRKYNRMDNKEQEIYEKSIENSIKDVYYLEKKKGGNNYTTKITKTEYDYMKFLENKKIETPTSKGLDKKKILTPKNVLKNRELAVKMGSKEQPIKLYHGTDVYFDKFNTKKMGTKGGTSGMGEGVYFYADKKSASTHAKSLAKETGGKANVIESSIKGKILNLDEKLPQDIVNKLKAQAKDSFIEVDEYANRFPEKKLKAMKELGYVGETRKQGGIDIYRVFDPKDIEIIKPKVTKPKGLKPKK